MKHTKQSILAIIAVLAILSAIGGGTVQAASTLQFDRGLPIANLNNGALGNRSNVAWSNGNDYVSGDDFTIGTLGQTWVVTQIRTWSVAGVLSGAHTLGDTYSDVTLYTSNTATGITQVMVGTLTAGSNTDSNSSITHTPVTYADVGLSNYQSTSGSLRQIIQNDFTLNWTIDGGVKQYFAVDGTPRVSTDYWFNHASNAALSGSTQQGYDNNWIAWLKSDLTKANLCDSGAAKGGVCDGGWDKSSDINVQVFANQVVVSGDKTACKQDGWMNLVRSDGTPFKNLGDCIQYVNTGK